MNCSKLSLLSSQKLSPPPPSEVDEKLRFLKAQSNCPSIFLGRFDLQSLATYQEPQSRTIGKSTLPPFLMFSQGIERDQCHEMC